MICSNCGSHIHEGDRFCNICGAFIAAPTNNGFPAAGNIAPNYSTEQPQSAPQSYSTPAPPVFTAQQPIVYPATAPQSAYYENTGMSPTPTVSQGVSAKKQKKAKKWGIFCAVLALLIVVSLALILALSKPYEKPIKKYLNCVDNGDSEGILSVLPPQFVDYMESGLEEEGYNIEEIFGSYSSKFGSMVSIDYTIHNSKKCSSDKLDSIKSSYMDYFGISLPCSKAYNVEVTAAYTYKDITATEKFEYYVIKVDGKWYIDFVSFATANALNNKSENWDEFRSALYWDYPELFSDELYK